MTEPLRQRSTGDGAMKRDLEFPPIPDALAVPVYDNHTHLEIADGENPLPPEENLRRAMLLSRGDWSVFVTRPLSASLLAAALVLLIIVLLPAVKSKREEAFVEE